MRAVSRATLLLCGISTFPILFVSPAEAQTASADAVVAGSEAAAGAALQADAAAPQADAVPSGSGEIVVTARQRTERLVDVPVAAAVADNARLEQYASQDLTSIGNQFTGVTLNRSGGGSSGGSLSIRGVGNLAADYGTESPIALVIDGMSLTRGHATDIGQFDLASVQVLKGPQSLFFGKNSPAGVIAISSNNPGKTFGGYIRGDYEFRARTP